MDNFEIAKSNMINSQILPCVNGIANNKVLLDALKELPRHKFVPEKFIDIAYCDEQVPLGNDRFLLPPLAFTKMLNALAVTSEDIILDVGCNRGYSSAVLGRLANKVVALEADEDLASKAHLTLNKVGVDNVIVITGNLIDGNADSGPYDAIFINGAVDYIPMSLKHQLTEGGRMIAITRDFEHHGNVTLIRRINGNFITTVLFETNFPCLPGFSKHEFVEEI